MINKILVPAAIVAGLAGGYFLPHSHGHGNPLPTGAAIGYTLVCDGAKQVPVKLQGTPNLVKLVPEYEGTFVFMTKNTQIANTTSTYETWSEITQHSCAVLTGTKGAIALTTLVAVTGILHLAFSLLGMTADIVIGCPVTQRSWVLPQWFGHVSQACWGSQPES